MAKFVILFVTLFFVATSMAHRTRSTVYNETPVYGTVSVDTVHDADYTELYTAFANTVFDFVAKLVRSKVDVILNIKSALIPVVVPGLVRVVHWAQNNKDTVNGLLSTALEVLRVFGGHQQVNVEHGHQYGVPRPEYGAPPTH